MAKRSKYQALHASDRSGYRIDVVGDEGHAIGTAVPRGSLSGGQEGLVSPPYRRYATEVEALSLSEAVARSIKRRQGLLPPVQPSARVEDQPPKEPRNKKAAAQEVVIPPVQRPMIPANAPPVEYQVALAPTSIAEPVREVVKETTVYVEKEHTEADKKRLAYLDKRRKVSVEIAGGKILMVVVDIAVDDYGILLIGSAGSESGIFIPDPGTDVAICVDDARYPCYFPGAKYLIADAGIVILPFVRAGE